MDTPRARLFVEERRRLIVDLVERQGRATVEELARRFDISPVTVRTDLEALACNAAIMRSHGGALPAPARGVDIPLRIKETRRQAQKRRIGHAAANLVEDGETIILDSGSTTIEIARALRQRKWRELTVITNGLQIALELRAIPAIRVMMLGGLLRPSSYSLVGTGVEHALLKLSADRLFLGLDGIDLEVGITTSDPQEAALNAMMVRVSREVIGVFDASKFGQRSLSIIGSIAMLDTVVTDAGADEHYFVALREGGVRLILI